MIHWHYGDPSWWSTISCHLHHVPSPLSTSAANVIQGPPIRSGSVEVEDLKFDSSCMIGLKRLWQKLIRHLETPTISWSTSIESVTPWLLLQSELNVNLIKLMHFPILSNHVIFALVINFMLLKQGGNVLIDSWDWLETDRSLLRRLLLRMHKMARAFLCKIFGWYMQGCTGLHRLWELTLLHNLWCSPVIMPIEPMAHWCAELWYLLLGYLFLIVLKDRIIVLWLIIMPME